MSRRLSMIPPALLLGVCLILLPACKKKRPTEDEGGGGGGPAAGAPAAVNSDYLVFARFNVKQLRDSTLFADTKQAVAKAGGTDEWNKQEDQMAREIGVRPTDVDTVTAVVVDAPGKGPPKFVIIIESSKPLKKGVGFGLPAGAKVDSRGFYDAEGDGLVHFPNDRTAVLVSESLAQQYLDGFAKGATGWPLTTDLTRAAANHTMFATVNLQKIPRDELGKKDAQELGSLLSAQKVTVTADLRGKELSLGARATFPDAATAVQAQTKVLEFVKMATKVVDEFAGGRELTDLPMLKPAVTEAQKAVKNVKIDVAGSDVTLAGSYKADFDIGQMAADVMKKVQASAGRVTAQNNLRQIGLALHNYESAMGVLPVHAVGANGQPLRGPADKPLLSWRVAILPYIEQENLYKKFKLNEAWDSPNNIALLKEMPKIFASVEKPGKPGFTHLQMIVGLGGMSPFGTTIVGISDGTSNTIAVIEATDAVEWTKPADASVPPKFAAGELKKKFGGQFAGGINVTMWDGSVRFIPDTVSERTLTLLFDPRDGNAIPADWDSSPSRPMGKK